MDIISQNDISLSSYCTYLNHSKLRFEVLVAWFLWLSQPSDHTDERLKEVRVNISSTKNQEDLNSLLLLFCQAFVLEFLSDRRRLTNSNASCDVNRVVFRPEASAIVASTLLAKFSAVSFCSIFISGSHLKSWRYLTLSIISKLKNNCQGSD